MSEFTKKYPMPEATFLALIKDGVISCSWPTYERIIIHYKESKSIDKTAIEIGVSRSLVHKIVHKFE